MFANHYLPLVIRMSNYIFLWVSCYSEASLCLDNRASVSLWIHITLQGLTSPSPLMCCVIVDGVQAEEERDDMEKVKLDNKRILFNLLPAHVAQHFLMSNPRNMVSIHRHVQARPARIISLKRVYASESSNDSKSPSVSWYTHAKRRPNILVKTGPNLKQRVFCRGQHQWLPSFFLLVLFQLSLLFTSRPLKFFLWPTTETLVQVTYSIIIVSTAFKWQNFSLKKALMCTLGTLVSQQ